jgi:hypothetical protein
MPDQIQEQPGITMIQKRELDAETPQQAQSCSPGSALSYFPLFGYVKCHLKELPFETTNECLSSMQLVLISIGKSILDVIFLESMQRLEQ